MRSIDHATRAGRKRAHGLAQHLGFGWRGTAPTMLNKQQLVLFAGRRSSAPKDDRSIGDG